jgi:primosomal protein N' (replication factor Y)
MPPTDATAPTDDFRTDVVAVLLPLPLAGTYDYRVPDDLGVSPGDFVRVPLGGREVTGVVWGPAAGDVDDTKLRPITARLDATPLPDEVRRFVEWVAAYTLNAPGAVLRMAVRAPGALEPPRTVTVYNAGTVPDGLRMTPARTRVLDIVADGPALTRTDLSAEAGVGHSVIKGLVEVGALLAHAVPPPPIFAAPDPDTPGPELSPDQEAAAAALRAHVAADRFAVILLDGVTGSGKTEVYLEAVAAALARGRQALVLLPEIALTPQWLDRFERRFGVAPAVWHSDLGQLRRRDTWRAVATGEARVVVGARSALFLPFAELGLIVIDEEHEPAFKQEDGVSYHGRDMAVVRARIAGCTAILASATPSLETRVNVARGRYEEITLPERFGPAELPAIETIDMREADLRADRFLSPRLVATMADTLAAGEQSMLFLNRRGYAPLTLCRTCGHRIACPSCTAWLTQHRFRKRIQCHHCGYEEPLPETCPSCGQADTLVACGPGVERLAEELREHLPDARIGIMTSDTMRGPDAAQRFVHAVEERELDVLIGTQMVAKGHHFPGLTLVGIVDADLGLSGGDLRAAERTYQVLQQVSGRAGRADRPGRVMIQTYQPEHPVMRALETGERETFMALETEARKAGSWPPFGRLAAIVVSSRDPDLADGLARELARRAPTGNGIQVLGPAPAPLSLLRGQHRRRLLLKTGLDQAVQQILRAWLADVRVPSRARLRIDIDPYSFL